MIDAVYRASVGRRKSTSPSVEDDDSQDSIQLDSLDFPPSSGASLSSSQPNTQSQRPSFLLPPPSQRFATFDTGSSRPSTRGSGFSSLPPPSQPRSYSQSRHTSTSQSQSTPREPLTSTSATREKRPPGVRRPPTSKKALSLLASEPGVHLHQVQPDSSRRGGEGALRETQTKSPASSQEREPRRVIENGKGEERAQDEQESVGEQRGQIKKRRSTTPSPSPPPPSLPPAARSSIRSHDPTTSLFFPPPSQSHPHSQAQRLSRTSSDRDREAAKRPRRSATPTSEPPPAAALLPSSHPPSAASRVSAEGQRQRLKRARAEDMLDTVEHRASAAQGREQRSDCIGQKALGAVPVFPPSSFRPRPIRLPLLTRVAEQNTPTLVHQARSAPQLLSPSPVLPSTSTSTSTSPTIGNPTSLPFSPTLLPSLHSLNPSSVDPSNSYGLANSLLFRIEYLQGGKPTWRQGGKKTYGTMPKPQVQAVAPENRVNSNGLPSWARTEEGGGGGGGEWETDLIQRLTERLALAPGRKGGEVFQARLWARDVKGLRRVRVGEGGGREVYVVVGSGAGLSSEKGGRGEFPCRNVVVTGWVVGKEWREKEGGWELIIDDGTALLTIFLASAPSASSASLLSPKRHLPPAPPPYTFANSTSSASIAHSHLAHPPPSPRQSIRARHAHLENSSSSLDEGDIRVGNLVRVLGRVEEGRYLWEGEDEGEARRVIAARIDVLTSTSEESKHHLLVSQLHRDVYSRPLDLRSTLQTVEREEREREIEASMMSLSSTAGGSSYAGGSEMGSSPGRVHYRPTRPSKLAPEDLTLSNFCIYVRHHLTKNYLRSAPTTAFDSFRSPSPSPVNFSDFNVEEEEEATQTVYALPFSLPSLQSNPHLSLFATRLVQRLAKTKAEEEERKRAKRARLGPATAAAVGRGRRGGTEGVWVAPPAQGSGERGGAGKPKVGQGCAVLLPPPSASASSSSSHPRQNPASSATGADTRDERRARKTAERAALRSEGPLVAGSEELEDAIQRVWKDALRTLRASGGVVEFVQLEQEGEGEGGMELEGEGQGGWDLPDEPRYVKGRKTRREEEGKSACPWGDPTLELSSSPYTKEEEEKKPRAGAKTHTKQEGGGGCPWGEVNLDFLDDDDEGGEVGDVVFKTPTKAKIPSLAPSSKTPRPAPPVFSPLRSARQPSRPRPSNRPYASGDFSLASDSSTTSVSTTHSLCASPGGSHPLFQLVTPLTLQPLILSILHSLSASSSASRGSKSSTELDIRTYMSRDDRWAKVAMYSDAVSGAIDGLVEKGVVEKYGKGVRLVGRGVGGWRTGR
ncbi:hypothetical protein JCM11641_000782 [Rhodosporidiobolus odoratus]